MKRMLTLPASASRERFSVTDDTRSAVSAWDAAKR